MVRSSCSTVLQTAGEDRGEKVEWAWLVKQERDTDLSPSQRQTAGRRISCTLRWAPARGTDVCACAIIMCGRDTAHRGGEAPTHPNPFVEGFCQQAQLVGFQRDAKEEHGHHGVHHMEVAEVHARPTHLAGHTGVVQGLAGKPTEHDPQHEEVPQPLGTGEQQG